MRTRTHTTEARQESLMSWKDVLYANRVLEAMCPFSIRQHGAGYAAYVENVCSTRQATSLRGSCAHVCLLILVSLTPSASHV